MASHPSLSLVISFFLFIAILHTLPLGLTSRKLLDLTSNSGDVTSPTTPVNDLNYTSQTKGGARAGVVSVNGQPRSERGTINDNDGNRKVDGTSHDGYQNGVINGNGGKPAISANGNGSVAFYDENGKPVYQINYPDNSAGTTGYSYIPPIPQYPNSPPIPQYPNLPPTIPQYPNLPPIPQYPNLPPTIPQYPNSPPIPQYPNWPPTIPQYPNSPPIPQYPNLPPTIPQYPNSPPTIP